MDRAIAFLERWGIVVLVVVTGLAYLPLLGNEFVWDDTALILDNRLTGDLVGNFGEMMRADLWHTLARGSADSGYYRPLMLLSLSVDRALFDLDPAAHHAHSILWHMACVGVLWGLLKKLVPAMPALLGAAIFALHPVQIEAVALVAARNDAMAAAFAMGAMLLVIERDARPWRLAVAAVLVWLGMLSKETAILAPVLLASIDCARYGRPVKWPRYVALSVGVLGFFAMRHWAGVGSAGLPEPGNFESFWPTLPLVVGTYGTLLVWPWPLTPARHIIWGPELEWPYYVGALVALSITVYALREGRDRKLGVVGLLWALAAWAPTLVATVDKGLMGERYLYFPMAGIALFIGGAVPLVSRTWKVGGAFVLLSILAIELRLPDWKDSRTLWQEAHEAYPTPYTAGGLAFYVYQDEDHREARQLFYEAVAGDPPYRDACTHLVMVGMALNDPEDAVELGTWGLKERGCPPLAETMTFYGLALASTGRWSEAVPIVQGADRDPFGHALLVLASESVRRGDFNSYEQLNAQWKGAVPLEQQVERLLRLSGEERAHTVFLAYSEGRLRIVTDPSELPEGAVLTPAGP
ncbi:MAG: glycosyltransferase family 39 protein [Proteobacteria bacterium]|nr:glycosyltransferase family 39 protein [Pseudomonadota bacterium]MCP4919238.1 glycosyltransferase family 39 protein [Pseudomonadota bacterium]